MTSYDSDSQRENHLFMFTPKTPHFFKIILEDTIRDRKLGIPRKFMRKYGNGLSSPVLLMVPGGATWHVELTESDGDVWLQNGWQGFVEHYSLKRGHFLVFKYEGDCNFQVLIFDMSTSEIEYPYISHTEDHKSDEECQEHNKEEALAVTSLEILHGTPPRKKTREKSRPPCSHPRKKLRTTPTDKNKRGCEDVSIGEGDLQTKIPTERHAFGANESDKALQRASAFISENPFFVVTMQPSYINPGRKMCIPTNFTTKFLKQNLGDITLCTLDGKTWSANYWRYISINKYTKAVLYKGWRAFMRDNKLEVGDVCVFELIKQIEILLKVVIYRVSEDSKCRSSLGGINSSANGGSGRLSTQRTTKSKHLCSMQPLTSHEKARTILRASDFKSENPFFKVVMQPAYLKARCSVNIPYKFTKRYLDEKKDQVTLQVSDGRTWIVKFSVNEVSSGQHKAKFYHTWKDFARDNNLEVGDVCVFELINCNETSFKVSIFSAAPEAKFSLSPQADDTRVSQVASKKCFIPKFETDDDFGNCYVRNSSRAAQFTTLGYQATEGINQKPLGLTSQSPKAAREKASMPPFFRRVVLSLHLKEQRLGIPFKFVEQHFKPNIQMVILQVADRSWPVKISSNPCYRLAKLTSGWIEFARENFLREGDICVYELDTVSNGLLKVSFSRSGH